MNMDFAQLAMDRYSVRKFSDKPIEKEKLDLILQAGRVAPTACNKQPQRVLVVNTAEQLSKLQKCTVCHYGETLGLVICYDKDDCWVRDYDGQDSGQVDASIVTTHMMLQAHALGIGSTWIMYFIKEAVCEEFDLPSNFVPVALLLMGYPAPDITSSPRHYEKKPLSETVFFNSFDDKQTR